MLVTYFFVHEGAHLLYALLAGVYKQINFMGLGVQIDVYAERMTDTQLGIFLPHGCVCDFMYRIFADSTCKEHMSHQK